MSNIHLKRVISIDSQTLLVNTPAYVYDENEIFESIKLLEKIKNKVDLLILFPLKSFSVADALCFMAPYLDGFSASSIFEAQLARHVVRNNKYVHMTTPGFRPEEIESISELCNYVSFNSILQWERYNEIVSKKTNCGLRVNPQLSFVKDERYDPCKTGSKLGTPLSKLNEIVNNGSELLRNVKGLHFHTNCESRNFGQLFRTVQHIDNHLRKLLAQVEWVNLGGGYLFEKDQDLDILIKTVAFLKNKYHVDVFLELGKAIIGSAGYIISKVIDIFENDGKKIAIIDTTINHMPEVFEYQYKPDIAQESEDGKYQYILAGSTCLAGDLFGEYRFDEPLEIGSRIVFEDMGAYTLVKANMFNGINLPSIYAYTLDGKLELKKQFGYEDFLSRCGVNNNDPI